MTSNNHTGMSRLMYTSKNLIIAASLILTLLTGCASRRQVAEPLVFPPIGATATRGVGEPLLSKGIGISEPALVVPEDTLIGTFLLKKGEYPFYSENSRYINFGTTANGGRTVTVYQDKEQNKICVSKDECAEIAHSLEPRLTKKTLNTFQQTLLYNGKIGNRITLAYREFDGRLARPAFNNEVAYDLAESTTLGYKGARIEVLKATNTEITYKVLAAFD